jgi:hypothetical protein
MAKYPLGSVVLVTCSSCLFVCQEAVMEKDSTNVTCLFMLQCSMHAQCLPFSDD